jgi:hypothetical protein
MQETKAIKHIKVDSSNIESIGYDRANLALEVRFKSGGLYRYSHVLPETVTDLLFTKHVKPCHPCARLEEAKN